jgi:hypothetical protein
MSPVLDAVTPYYLDAGTGSMLVQMVVAGVAGIAVFAKVFWARITGPFRRKRSDDAPATGRDDAQQPEHQPADD